LGYVLPLHTSHGDLVFALGYYRPRTFLNKVSFRGPADPLFPDGSTVAYLGQTEGSLDQYRLGMGMEVSPNLGFGLAIGYLDGEEDLHFDSPTAIENSITYHGVNLEPSMVVKLSDHLKLGFSLIAWERIFNLQLTANVKSKDKVKTDFTVKDPFQVKTGLAYEGNSYLVAADFRLNGWSQYQYRLDSNTTFDKTDYKDEFSLSLGLEKRFVPHHLAIRAGYTLNTLQDGEIQSNNLQRWSAGFGFEVSNSFTIDGAYSFAYWTVDFPSSYTSDAYVEQRELVTLAYHY